MNTPTVEPAVANLVTVFRTPPGLPNVRLFDVDQINAHIDESLKLLPEDKRVAMIAFADGSGARAAIVGRVMSDKVPGEFKWTVYAVKPYSGAFTWGAGAIWSM